MTVDFNRLDRRTIRPSRGSIDAYLVVRNEVGRLPYLLDYHRALGVDRFFVVDNGSDDGTPEFLLGQDDCFVHQTTASFSAARCGMDWINALVEHHGMENWCLFIDADELFVYPHAERLGLRQFCRFLEESGHEGVFAIMVDMYGPGPLAASNYVSGTPFLETCPLFDPDYQVRAKVALPFRKRFADLEAVGGPRLRQFYPEYRHAGVWRTTAGRAARALRHSPIGRMLRLQGTNFGLLPPDITKIPLMRGRPGRRWVTNHRTVPLPLSPVTGALLHFKFFSDFDARARSEAARGQHWGSGTEYQRYVSLLASDPHLAFAHEASITYRSTDDLLRCRIITTTSDFDRFAGIGRRDCLAPSRTPAAPKARPDEVERSFGIRPSWLDLARGRGL